jgi:uncharacterized membrane protein
MKEIQTYFRAERMESLIFLCIGIVSLLLSAWFWWSLKKSFYEGMSWPLIGVGLIQVLVGTGIYFRTPSDIKKAELYLTENKNGVRSAEIPRMETVMRNFVVYRYVELSLALLGLALIFIYHDPGFWKGFGAGLFAQAILMLILDRFAESRGKTYLAFLYSLT